MSNGLCERLCRAVARHFNYASSISLKHFSSILEIEAMMKQGIVSEYMWLPVLYNGITLANFMLLGKVPDRNDWLQIM